MRVLLAEGFPSTMVLHGDAGATELQGSPRGIVVRAKGRPETLTGGFRIRAAPGRLLTVGGKRLRGEVEAFLNPLGVAVLVNVINLEDYLRGVIPKELSPRMFPEIEALKAQAVAARTFSVSEIGARARLGFDLYPDQRSQVYEGAGVEDTLSNQAVDSTGGAYLAFEGEPIVAFYSSTCGGVTADYSEAFEKPPIPYLTGGVKCPDHSSRHASWVDEFDVSSRQPQLDRYASIGKLTNLQILNRTGTGRVREVRFTGDAGEVVLRGLKVRYALGLKSHFIESISTQVTEDGRIRRIRVEGRGWGHGVGLCQVGAFEWARRGMDFRWILAHYYPGADLLQLHEEGS